ncbi:MAG: transcriptional repressor [Alphaproteobacteria bacterium]|nr:transcriptional repressor [Alphaproteobacteria bacterium]
MHEWLRKAGNETVIARMRQAGIRPTRQRNELANLLFRNGHRHLTAEMLHAEVLAEGIQISLGTIYNTLRQFTQAGLLLEIVVNPTRSYFDTNTVQHQHFYCEDDDMLVDISGTKITVTDWPTPPSGTQVKRVDVVVHVRRH